MIRAATDEPTLQQAISRLDFNVQIEPLANLIRSIYVDAGRVMGAKAYQQLKQNAEKLIGQSMMQFKKKYPSDVAVKYSEIDEWLTCIEESLDEYKRLMPIGYNEELIQEIIQYFQIHLLDKAVLPISDTMKEWILDRFIDGQQQGKSLSQIKDELIKHDFPKNRAIVITRTEVLRASNHGAVAGAKKAGYKTNKMWISAKDFRTRRIPRDEYSHVAMDGITVPLEEPFHVPRRDGGYDFLMQPGDPAGDPANTIMCRCSVGFSVVRGTNGLPIRV